MQYEQFLAELATQYCPNLEIISIDCENSECLADVTESLLKQLVQNCPKLKRLKLVRFRTSELSNDFIFEVYETKNVFLDVWNNRPNDLAEFERHVSNQNDEFCARYFKRKMSNDQKKCKNCK